MGGDGFTLHPQLAADTVEVTRWPLSMVLLNNDATYPWLVLVPQLPELRDLHDVPADCHGALMAEIGRASRALQAVCEADKINVAALGNQVPQLHIHVIARRTGDPAWPRPVWGVVPARAYSEDARTQLIGNLTMAFGGAA
jgi:diadenosine tetraphosphate (Ap4A) HIT family hydrolase